MPGISSETEEETLFHPERLGWWGAPFKTTQKGKHKCFPDPFQRGQPGSTQSSSVKGDQCQMVQYMPSRGRWEISFTFVALWLNVWGNPNFNELNLKVSPFFKCYSTLFRSVACALIRPWSGLFSAHPTHLAWLVLSYFNSWVWYFSTSSPGRGACES